MPKVSFKHLDQLQRRFGRDVVPAEKQSEYSEGELEGAMARYFPTDTESLELTEYTFPGGTEIHPHSHTVSEIIYILKGQIRFAGRVCPPGTALYIDKDVRYGFQAGPQGVTFLNFRGLTGSRLLTRDESSSVRAATNPPSE
jgi:hypothetical protein